jgi:RNA 2',3'-cyclic 3'-phosphodiesterase
MTLPPVIRIFFAIDLPPIAKEKLGRYISMLKKKSRSNSIRWTKPDNLHITLQFLAEVHAEHLPALIDAVRVEMAGAIKRCTLTWGTIHLFPSPYRPRVIVLEMAPQDHLAKLSELIGRGIKASHYEIDTRPFRAHLTLGRIKQPQDIHLSFLSEAGLPDVENIDINEVVLFRSEPLPEGSKYTVMERMGLDN